MDNTTSLCRTRVFVHDFVASLAPSVAQVSILLNGAGRNMRVVSLVVLTGPALHNNSTDATSIGSGRAAIAVPPSVHSLV